MGTLADYPIRSKKGEPVWEIATHYPPQGTWTKDQFLIYTDGRRGIEFNAGTLEFLPMPTRTHQEIVFLLCQILKDFLNPSGGDAWLAGIRVRTAPHAIRETDVVVMLDKHDKRAGERVFEGADLLVEVVSDDADGHRRDYEDKREEYAQAGVPEYWIVDPVDLRITVLKLEGNQYAEHSIASEGETALSALLEGFSVEATKVFHRD